jgi:hypothetical protein
MKKLLIPAMLGFAFSVYLSAQESDTIVFHKWSGMNTFSAGNEYGDLTFVSPLLRSNPASSGKFKSSRTNAIIGCSIGIIGSGVILTGVVCTPFEIINNTMDMPDNEDYFIFPDKSFKMILTGIGIDLISIPFFLMANSDLKASIRLYNSDIKAGNLIKPEFYTGFTGEGIGLGFKF